MAGSLVDRSLLALTRDLVRIPSRAGIDPYGPIYQCIADWLEAKGISVEVLSENGVPLAATATVGEVHKGPTYLLIATADTAGFGEETTWTFEPTSGELCEGWLHGRGSADSKAGIAIFCHVAAALFAESDQLHGAVTLVFDAEEHSGRFLGIQRAMASLSDDARVAGAMIGYPGQDKIVIGCRGFLRAEICIHGKAAHSGSSREHGVNAITRAVELAQNLQKAPLSQVTTREFHLPPQLTITSIRGGIGDSSVPDLCRMRLDIRLTPTYDAEAAKKTIEEAVRRLDKAGSVAPTEVRWEPGWPAYVVPHDHPMVQALWQSAREVLNKEVLRKVAGPSSVGNLLALRGIPATAGFGVIYQNAHGTNERILVESLQPVYECYLNAVRALLRD